MNTTQSTSAVRSTRPARVTAFEALAQKSNAVGLSRSNQSTPSAADADDQ
jgi:hypothetical protein